MKVVVLYRPVSDHARRVEEFVHDFKHHEPKRRIETIDVDSPQGISLANLYDIVAYPAVIALRDDGQLLKHWQGDEWPLMNELAFYAQ